MKERLKVKENKSFVRDPESSAIINTDDIGYQQYMAKNNSVKRRDEEIRDLKMEVSQIKELLIKILEKE
tara:strand:- start:1 stop:207 length:207 start_codon:yes stop_codon:yes gene_type:complete